jgi:hypothetical protein
LAISLSSDYSWPIIGFLLLRVLDLLALHRVDLVRRIGLALDDRSTRWLAVHAAIDLLRSRYFSRCDSGRLPAVATSCLRVELAITSFARTMTGHAPSYRRYSGARRKSTVVLRRPAPEAVLMPVRTALAFEDPPALFGLDHEPAAVRHAGSKLTGCASFQAMRGDDLERRDRRHARDGALPRGGVVENRTWVSPSWGNALTWETP